jgi:hypothetical protein
VLWCSVKNNWEAAVLPLNYTRARGALYRAAHRFGKLPFIRPLA